MKKKNLLIGLILGLGLFFLGPKQIKAADEGSGSCNVFFTQASFNNPRCVDNNSPVHITVSNIIWEGEPYTGRIWVETMSGGTVGTFEQAVNGTASFDYDFIFGDDGHLNDYLFTSTVKYAQPLKKMVDLCGNTNKVLISQECTEEEREVWLDKPFDLCKQIPDGEAQAKCTTCFNQNGVWTAIGCIDTSSTEGIVSKLMKVGMSIAGGIALLMILASAFLFATSAGETKRTSEAKEILTSAIIGLIFIIFSVTILQFIGVNILRIPGFGE